MSHPALAGESHDDVVDLRDRFAIAALPGLIGLVNPREIAETAYSIADAMLLERAK